jgi:hypothetical protein
MEAGTEGKSGGSGVFARSDSDRGIRALAIPAKLADRTA